MKVLMKEFPSFSYHFFCLSVCKYFEIFLNIFEYISTTVFKHNQVQGNETKIKSLKIAPLKQIKCVN
jgi:hypothetical protein